MTSRFTTLTTVTLLATMTLAGCSSSDEPDYFDQATSPASPSPSSTATASPSTSASLTTTFSPTEQEVINAALKYWDECLPQTFANPEKAYDLLAPCTTEPASQTYPRGFTKRAEESIKTNGSFANHKFKKPMFISQDKAEVYDCLDASQIVTKNTKTGEVVSRGTNPASSTLRMIKTDEGWRVSEVIDAKDDAKFCD